MKKILLLFLVLLCTVAIRAAQRSPEEALTIAQSFFMQSSDIATRNVTDIRLVAASGDLLGSASTRKAQDGAAFYIYNNARTAYVIVSGDDRMKPVLAYSDKGSFITENLPANLIGWLEFYKATYEDLNNGKKAVTEPRLLTRSDFASSVSPLLNVNWNQDEPYNNACPLVGRERTYTGCVATAMAMILKYYNYPEKGKGSYSYETSDGIECSFDYGNTTFDWNNMLPQYTSGNYTVEQANAVSRLMYACGVAIDMEYSPTGSGAYSYKVAQALIDYFNYDANMGYVYREFFTSAEWMNMIKTELSAGRPILYNGASKDVGHAFVFDGYDGQDMVHVNWGWGGANNGYFEVASLDPSSPGIGGGTNLGGGYAYQQGMLVGFQPPATSSSYTSYFQLSKLEVSKKEVIKGERFELTVTGIYNMSSEFRDGKLGLIAEKDGEQSVLWNTTLGTVGTYLGYDNRIYSNISIPRTFIDGTYALYLATKDVRETAWSRVRGALGTETQFTLVISDNKCVMTPFTGNLNIREEMDADLEVLHNLYGGHKGDFKILFSNRSTTGEYYGLAGVMFYTAEENPVFKTFIGGAQMEMKPGVTNKELLISDDLVTVSGGQVMTDLPAGDYYIIPGLSWGEYVYPIGKNPIPVSVKESAGTVELVVSQPHLEKEQIQVGEKLKLQANLSLSGTGNVYDKFLMAAIFAVGQRTTSNLHYADVFLEKEQSLNFEMEIEPNVGEGNYFIDLYKQQALSEGYENVWVCSLNFSVGPTTGIADTGVADDEIIIYQQPVDGILRIHTGNIAQSIAIYNLAGQKVIQQQESEDKMDKEYSVPVEGLPAGYYIVVLQTTDGKIYRSKFIKR